MDKTIDFTELEQFIADMRASGYEFKLIDAHATLNTDSVTVVEEFSFAVSGDES
ncbi:hypothetical protein [Pseudobacillus badius]|uniref:hypothetical protein n=1 Tax=Bacillus badius TaxID=1455 RepID=UPI0024A08618|nr:hypothetical protein [Bacillus badius]GLY11405.1 hypothetical protein Bbad01_26210 [Bacillus badius]